MADCIDLTFLGTSSAQPNPSRSHSSFALRIDGRIWIFDAGEGTQHRLIQNNAFMTPPETMQKLILEAKKGEYVSANENGEEQHRKDKRINGHQNHKFNSAVHSGNSGFNVAMNATSLKFGKIEKFFVTHMHGDHVLGLPGALCTISQNVGNTTMDTPEEEDHDAQNDNDDSNSKNGSSSNTLLQIYGPPTLRRYLRFVLKCTSGGLGCKYQVNELHTSTLEMETSPLKEASFSPFENTLHPNEIFGQDILINEKTGSWDLFTENDIHVEAAPILHSVPCIGYVIQEQDSPGKLLVDKLAPILEENADLIKNVMKVNQPKSLYAQIKSGRDIELPNGIRLVSQDFLSLPRKGRKIVILGDTFDPSGVASIAQNADILVHEATNAYITPEQVSNTRFEQLLNPNETYEKVKKNTMSHGHSTPEMAGEFAKRIGAKCLLLNHFSSRYKDDGSEESEFVLECIRQCAINSFDCHQVVCTKDFMTVYVPKRK